MGSTGALSALELAAGWVFGTGAPPRGAGPVAGAGTPLEALQTAVAPFVTGGRCFVAFSGGRDSSLVLAAAARAARRAGAPPPVPLTLRYPGDAATQEDHWQALVLDHVGVGGQVVVDVAGDVDLVGDRAAAHLRRLGVRFPANGFSLAPLMDHARNGVLLTGLGGDELLRGHAWGRLQRALAARRPPSRRELRTAAIAALPPPARRRVLARRDRELWTLPWLRPAARRLLRRRWIAAADEPVRFSRAVLRAAAERSLTMAEATVRGAGALHGVAVRAPLLDPGFVQALARAGGALGFGGAGPAMRAVAGDALPPALLDRSDKAVFTASFFGPRSRAFAERWSGGGVPAALVDAEALRAGWLSAAPDFRSALLLQAAWLHDDRAR